MEDPFIQLGRSLDILVRLAKHGLIHCDLNEFNLMVKRLAPKRVGQAAWYYTLTAWPTFAGVPLRAAAALWGHLSLLLFLSLSLSLCCATRARAARLHARGRST